MVLEYVPGETLQKRLRKLSQAGKHMPPEEARDLVAGICDALEYAHARGMIHRDVKPANIMITPEGQPILMDFGIAKIVGGEQLTATGAVVGTASYISPEQVTGGEIDARVDIYSLGVTLFELLSGRPPFEGNSAMTVMMKHVNDPVPDLTHINPSVPGDLAAVTIRALEKDRNKRFGTAAEMATALRRANSSAEITGLGMTLPGGSGADVDVPKDGGPAPQARNGNTGDRPKTKFSHAGAHGPACGRRRGVSRPGLRRLGRSGLSGLHTPQWWTTYSSGDGFPNSNPDSGSAIADTDGNSYSPNAITDADCLSDRTNRPLCRELDSHGPIRRKFRDPAGRCRGDRLPGDAD